MLNPHEDAKVIWKTEKINNSGIIETGMNQRSTICQKHNLMVCVKELKYNKAEGGLLRINIFTVDHSLVLEISDLYDVNMQVTGT